MQKQLLTAFSASYTLFTRSSKCRAIIEQTSSKCIQNTRARLCCNCSMSARWLFDVCL